MATRKKVRKSRSRKSRVHKRHSKSYFLGGSCSSCGSCMNGAAPAQSFLKGGQNCMGKQRGGNDNPPSFNGLPLRYYYGQNTYANDPQHAQTATRQLPNKYGGSKKNKTRKNHMSGGSGIHMTALSGAYGPISSHNPINTIGETSTSNIAAKIFSGGITPQTIPNPSILQQPTNAKYNSHNMPKA